MIKRQILFIFLIFFMIPIAVKAEGNVCTYEDHANLQTLANNIKISYEYDKNNQKYNIIINNFSYNFMILSNNHEFYVRYNESSVVKLNGYLPDHTYVFPLYATELTQCPYVFMMNKSIYLPPHNDYYDDPLCVGNEEFELCKEFTPIKIDSYKEFKQRVTQYILDKEKQKPSEEEEVPEEKVSLWSEIIDFLLKYNLYILVPIIMLGTTGIVIIEIKKRKSIL